MEHYVNTKTNKCVLIDNDYRVYTCSCKNPDVEVMLCLTLDESLKKEGELRELNRQIAVKRKELGLLLK